MLICAILIRISEKGSGTMTKFLIRLFIGNSDNTADSDVRKKYGYLGAFTGITLNIILFTGKFIAGILSGAVSVMADAFNNLSDAGSSIMTFVGFKIAGTPADKDHPFGHGRMEYVSGLVISFVIMLMGFELGKTSFAKIISPEDIEVSKLTIGVLITSVCVKLWMAVFNRKLGKIINSGTLRAASADSMTDSVATTAVIIAMLISLICGVNIDGYVGILVALFIFYTGFVTCRDSLGPLLGARPDSGLVKEIEDVVLSYPSIIGVHDLIVHDYGVGNMIVSLHAEVPCTKDFNEAHELIDLIEDDLKIRYKCLATIHMDPVAVDDEETDEVKAMLYRVLEEIDPILKAHDFRMTKGVSHVNLIFDVVVPFGYKMSDNAVIEVIRDKLSDIDEKYFAVINVDKDMS